VLWNLLTCQSVKQLFDFCMIREHCPVLRVLMYTATLRDFKVFITVQYDKLETGL